MLEQVSAITIIFNKHITLNISKWTTNYSNNLIITHIEHKYQGSFNLSFGLSLGFSLVRLQPKLSHLFWIPQSFNIKWIEIFINKSNLSGNFDLVFFYFFKSNFDLVWLPWTGLSAPIHIFKECHVATALW